MIVEEERIDLIKEEANLIAKIEEVEKALAGDSPKGLGLVGVALKKIVGKSSMVTIEGKPYKRSFVEEFKDVLVRELGSTQEDIAQYGQYKVIRRKKIVARPRKALQKETRPMSKEDVLSSLLRLQAAIRTPVRTRHEAHRLIVRIREAQKMVLRVKVKVKVAMKTCGGRCACGEQTQSLATDDFNSTANAAVQCLASASYHTRGGFATAVSTLRAFNSELSATIAVIRQQKDGSVLVTHLGACDESDIPKVRKAVEAVVKSLDKGPIPLPKPGLPKKRGKRRSIRPVVTQEQVAEDTGIALRTIQYWESGEVTPLLNYSRMVRIDYEVYQMWLKRYLAYRDNKEKAQGGGSKRVRFEEGTTDAVLNNGGLNGGCRRLATEEVRPEDRRP